MKTFDTVSDSQRAGYRPNNQRRAEYRGFTVFPGAIGGHAA